MLAALRVPGQPRRPERGYIPGAPGSPTTLHPQKFLRVRLSGSESARVWATRTFQERRRLLFETGGRRRRSVQDCCDVAPAPFTVG